MINPVRLPCYLGYAKIWFVRCRLTYFSAVRIATAIHNLLRGLHLASKKGG